MRTAIGLTARDPAAALTVSATPPNAVSVFKTMVSVPQSVKEIIEELDRAVEEEKRRGGAVRASTGRRRSHSQSPVEKTEESEEETERRRDEVTEKRSDKAAAKIDAVLARPPERREATLATIRRFRRDASLKLTYLATTSNPYRDDESLIETYADEQGNEYWVDPTRDFLVQMGPGAGAGQAPHQVRPDDRLPVAELRRLAVELIENRLPDFARRRSSLHPLEDNRDRKVYFFRWDDFSAPLKESELPPFIQAALYADGQLASYTDTLSR